MRVMFFQWEFPPDGAGIGRYAARMAEALASLGHEALVYAARAPGCPEESEPVPRVRVRRAYDRSAVGSEGLAREALDYAKSNRVDVIECPDHLGIAAPLLALPDRPPIVVKSHYNDLAPAMRYAQAHYRRQRLLIDLACLRQRARLRRERESLEGADAVIFPCRRMETELLRAGIRLPPRRAVCPNPISVFEPPEELSEVTDRPTVLFLGRLDFGKGIGHLPALWARVRARVPNATLEIGGPDSRARFIGSMEQWLRRRLREADGAQFLGPLDATAVEAAYGRAWTVIVPSMWDTFPNVILEAMARGKAIVASPHGGAPEMLEGASAVIADPASARFGEAVATFLLDSARRRVAGESARERARNVFAPSVVAGHYIQCLESWW